MDGNTTSTADEIDVPAVYSSLLAAMRSLFINAQCSDLVVKCGSREWKVHKAIVLPQIEVVAKAFEGGFKEDTDNAYTFKDVDPAAVHAMLQFLYTGIYSADGNDVVSCHIHVIKLAEQYMLSLLCDLAAKKFEACMWRRWDQPDFAVAVDLIYAHGPDSMSRLKTTLLDIGRKHMAVLLREPETHPDFHEVVRRVPGFLADLCTGMSLFNNTIDLTAVVCPYKGCGYTFAIDISRTEPRNLYCPSCGSQRLATVWADHKREA